MCFENSRLRLRFESWLRFTLTSRIPQTGAEDSVRRMRLCRLSALFFGKMLLGKVLH